ncbi:MAG: hypothetical protein RLZZ360_98 [Candidatus Parcubacteria bacterium]
MSHVIPKLNRLTLRVLLVFVCISGFLAYSYIDRTVYTTEELLVVPGGVVADGFDNPNEVLIQDVDGDGILQNFTNANSAHFKYVEPTQSQTPSPAVPTENPPTGTPDDGAASDGATTDTPPAETPATEPSTESTPPTEPVPSDTPLETSMRAVAYPLAQFDETTPVTDAVPVVEEVAPDTTAPDIEPASAPNEASTPEIPEVTTATPTEASDSPSDASETISDGATTSTPESPAAVGTTTTDLFGLEPCLVEAGCKTRSLTFDNFALPEFTNGTVLDTVQLRLSLAAKAKPGSAIQRFVVSYSLDAGATYLPGTVIDVGGEISNSLNGDHFLVALAVSPYSNDLSNLRVKVAYEGIEAETEAVFVDGVWLDVTSGRFYESSDFEKPTDAIGYERDLKAPSLNELVNADLDQVLGKSPMFTLSYDPQQGFFNRIFRSIFAENTFAVDRVSIKNPDGTEIPALFDIKYYDDLTWSMQVEELPYTLAPGKYEVTVEVLENGEKFTDTFEFYWGLLAVNTKKSMYFPNEEVVLNLAALTDSGDTICDANLEMKIIDPKGAIFEVPVSQSGSCNANNVTDVPDYLATFKDTGEWGKYTIQLQHLNVSGEVVHKITDSFEVRDYIPFDITRTAPTRIYPPAPYKVELKVKANRTYTGDITERVPRGFIIEGLEGATITALPQYSLITWSNVTMNVGDERTFSYTFDAPDVSPYMYLLGPLTMDSFSELRQWQIASDALNNIGWFKGTRTVAGTNLNSVPSPMQWSTSSIDNYYYTHSTSSNSQRVTLRQSGDYFVAVNLPVQRTDANTSRTRSGIEVRKNGVAVQEGLGRSGYIENAGAQSESSSNVAFLLTDVNANDYIEVFVENLNTIDAGDTVNVSGLASLYVEYMTSSDIVFAATTTRSTATTSLNTATANALDWIETRQDTGFVHSNTVSPQNITLSATGTYMVHVNIPLTGVNHTVQTNVTGRVLINGMAVPGAQFMQGYMETAATESDGDSSIHWSGVVVASSTNSVLTVTAQQEAGGGNVVVTPGFAGSIVIEKLPTAGVIAVTGNYFNGTTGMNFNNTNASSTRFNVPLAHDTGTYTYSSTTNSHQITVGQSGDYFLMYNVAVTGATARTNNRITVTVNGATTTGAQTKSNYIRNQNGHTDASGNLVFLLEGVGAGQIVSVQSQQEATAGQVSSTTPATLMLWKKAALDFRPAAPTLQTPFDNARFASTSPYFEFTASDPDGASDIEYEFSISTSSTFATATVRVSSADAGFVNTVSGGDTAPFTEGNKIRYQLQPGDTLTDLTTYYWRVRAKDVTGSGGFGDYSTTQSFTVNAGDTVANWYQTTSGQFQTNTLFGATANDVNNNVTVNSTVSSEIMLAYGDGTNTTPRYRLWNGTSWGIEQSAIAVGGTINWVRTAAGVKRDEYILVTMDQSNATYAQVYNATSSSWGNQTLITSTVSNVTRKGIAVGYESVSGDAMVVSCSNTKDPVYRTWNGSTWSATSSITTSLVNVCNHVEIASDPTSDEMILVVRDSGAAVGNNYEALVWDGTGWISSRVLGSVQAGQELRAGIGVKYESSGDQAVIAVTNGTNNNFAYVTWLGPSLGWSSNGTQALFNDFEFGSLAADPNSDLMTLCFINDSARVGAIRWDGSVWTGTFTDFTITGNSQAGRPVDCEYETTAGRSGYILGTYSDTTNLRYRTFATSTWDAQQTVSGVGSGAGVFWVQTERAGDGTIVAISHDDAVAGDEIESTYWNGTNWSTKQSIVPNPSSIIGAPYETFEMAAKRYTFTQGIVTTQPIVFTSVPNQNTWGDLSFGSTEPFGTDVTVKLKYTNTTTCDTYIPDGALPGNSTGFDQSAMPLNLTSLSTSTYSQICLEATLTTFGSQSASLDDWSVAWLRKPKLVQSNFRWYANGSFFTPTDAWPVGGTDVNENVALSSAEAVSLNDVLRLRLSLQGANVPLATSTSAFKLQYAPGSSCSIATGWSDVGAVGSTTALWRGYANSIVGSDWYGAAWGRRIKIEVDNALVGTSSAVTDFPVYVNLDDLPAVFFDTVQSDGDDIRITTSDGITEVPYELVAIDTSADTGELHFKAPSLSTTTDTGFYIYYGNSGASGYAATATYGRNNVWNNGYQAVYHLGTNPTSAMIDSTSNGRNLTSSGMVATNSTSSKIGNGLNFDGVNDYLTNTGWSWNTATVTVTAWNNVSTAETQNSNLFSFTAAGAERFAAHAPWGDAVLYWDFGTCCSAPGRLTTNYTSYRNKWTHVGLVSHGTGGTFMGIYLDGAPIATAATSDNPNVALTGFALGSVSTAGGTYHRGRIDEFRIASVARSASWLKTEYNNQTNATGFYTVQAEELIGDGRVLPSTLLSDSNFSETYEENNPTILNRNGLLVGQKTEWDFTLQNNGATANTSYCFRLVYADGAILNTYSTYPRLITNAAPLQPTLTAPFDNRQLASTTPTFEFAAIDELGDLVSYEVVIDNDADFSSPTITRESNADFSQFTNIASPSERSQYSSGQTIQFVPNTGLTNGVTYWWRVRAKDDFGSNTYGSWSEPRSFTVNSATTLTTWFQTTGDQFNTNSLNDALANVSTNDVGINTSFTAATTTTTEIDYDNRAIGNAWGSISFNQNVTSGTIRHYVEYEVSSNNFALVPDTDLPGNSAGFASSPISIAALDTTTYNVLRITSVFSGNATLPRLLDMTVTWSLKIEPPTHLTLFDNAKTATVTPAFTFTTIDPQADDLQYEIQISTTQDFAAPTTFMSGVDAGFSNVTTPADTSPFNSGNTIRYQTQAPLTNSVTYWWRTRARDPGGSNSWSNYSTPFSFTVDTATNVSVWYQTTGEQFSTNDTVDIETTLGGAQVSSVINGVMVAYAEGTAQAPQYRTWNGSAWSAPISADTVSAQIRWTRLKAATTRPEYALGTLGTDLDINIQIYDAITESWGNIFEIVNSATESTKRRYDIAYETVSGKLMAVACLGNDAVYATWDGSSWSATSSLVLANTNDCEWVQMASDPVSNEIIAVFRHTNTGTPDYEALVWNGSSWGNSNRFGDVSANTNEGMVIEYEESGDQAVLALPNGTVNMPWKTWNGSTWSATNTVALGNVMTWGSLKRDEGTDRMMLCYMDADTDIGIVPWTGSAFGTFTELTITGNDNRGLPADCDFQTTQGTDGDVVIAYSDTVAARYQTYSFGTGTTSGEFSLDVINNSWRFQTVRGGDGTVHALAFDDGSNPDRYDTSRWNGSVWTARENFSSSPSIAAQPFDGSLTIAAQIYPNFTSASIRSTAINFADGASPRWERVRFTDTTPGLSNVLYRVYYETTPGTFALVPDSALSGNAAGFTNSPINISGLDKNIYNVLKLDAELLCDSGNCPSVQDWSVEWSEGLTISGSIFDYDQLTALASGTVAVAVNGVLQSGKTAQVAAGTSTQQVVYTAAGTSTFTVPSGVTSVTVKSWGAGGGSGASYSTNGGGAGAGGGGGFVQGNVTTIPAENLTVRVGGGGAGGTAATSTGGGGGGGYSGVFRTSTPLLVAGGGGGGGGGVTNIKYVGAGTACGVNGAACTPTIPASTAVNDLYIAVLHSRTDTAHTCTTNCTGWTEFSTQAGSAGEGRVSVWYYRRTGAAPANPTFAGPATESYTGRIWAFRGAAITGNPYDVLGTNTAVTVANTVFTGSNLSSTVPDAMVVHVGGSMDNNTWGPGGGSCNTPNAADANFYAANANGTDNSVFLCYRDNPISSAGSLGAPTMTQATLGADVGRYFTFALRPQATDGLVLGNGGAGGGLTGETGSTTAASGGGGGGTQVAGGAIGGSNATVGAAYQGGLGAGTAGGVGAGGAGGIGGGGTGGSGSTTAILAGGGGGGAGYYGGGGGANASDFYTHNPGAGGGGGSSYTALTGVSATSTISGSGTQAANTADPDYSAGVGVGAAAVTSITNGSSGGNGKVVVTWSTVASAGTWSIPNVSAVAGDVITVFIQNASGTDEAVAVTVYDGSGDITGMQLSKRHLTIGSNDGTTVTNANLALYANAANEDIFYSASGGSTISLCAESTCSDARLRVLSGATYAPGADTSVINFQNNGTFAPATSTFRISNVWDNQSTFTVGQSTIIFTATTSTQTPQNASSSLAFYNVTFGESSGNATFTLTKPLITYGNLTVNYGTLARGTTTLNIGGNLSLGANGTFSGLGTTTFDGTGSSLWGDAKAANLSTNIGNVVIDGTAKTITLSGNVGSESLTIGNDDTLNASGSGFNINVLRHWTNNNAFVPQSGTVSFIGTSTGVIARGTSAFNNLSFTGVGGNWSFSTSTLALNGTLTIATGTVTLPTGTTTIGGSFLNTGGQFAHNNGEVRMTSSVAGRSITTSGTPFLNNFYDLVFTGAGGWTFTGAATTTRDMRITAGTVTMPTTTLAVGGDFVTTGSGAFAHNNGEVILLVQDADTLSTNGSSFNNLRVRGAASGWYNDSWSARKKITIQGSKVMGSMTNFPVYLNLADLGDDFFTGITTGGADIRITASDGVTEVPLEVVSVSTSTKRGEVYFRAPSLATSTSADFYVYYGNSGATAYASTSAFGAQNVWTNGYQAVYHLDSDPAGITVDSTRFDRRLSQVGAMDATDVVAGVLGNAIDFDGVNDYLTNAAFAWVNASNTITVTAWNNVTTAETKAANLFGFTESGGQRVATHGPWSDAILYWDFGAAGVPGRVSSSYASYRNKWTHIGLVSPGAGGGNMSIYFDGAFITSSTASDPNVTLTGFSLGSLGASQYHDGRIDEFRLASVVRDAGWLGTEFNNQSTSTSFYSTSTAEARFARVFTDTNTTILGNYIADAGASATFPSGILSVGGSFDNNGAFSANNGTVRFNSTAGSETIAVGSSTFATLEFNGAGGDFTVTESATATVAINLTNATQFTLQSGLSLTASGTFSQTMSGTSTTWTGSLLRFIGTDHSMHTKSFGGDVYGTLQVANDADIAMWNSSATTYITSDTGSIYSQDHAAVDGDLNIYGNYIRSTGTEHWAYATDFDGTVLGSPRQVDVRVASGSSVGFTAASLNFTGTSSASTTIAALTGSFSLNATNSIVTARYFSVASTGSAGFGLLSSTTLSQFDDGYIDVTPGTSGLRIDGTTVSTNPAKQLLRVAFATTTAGTGANVTFTGTSTSFVWFKEGSGNLYGEAFDSGDANPGAIRFDDSSYLITVSGRVLTSDGGASLGAPVCDGVTPNVRVVVNSGSYTAQTSCNVTTGAYSFSNVAFIGDPKITVYLNTNGGVSGAAVTKTPTSDITNLDVYAYQLITRHEGAVPLSIADLTLFDTASDTDMRFSATTTPSTSLTVLSNNGLFVWASTTFTPGGPVTLAGNASSSAFEGSLTLATSSQFIAAGTDTHSLAGRLVVGQNATITAASSTFVFTATTTGKSITAATTQNFHNLSFTGVGGAWNIGAPLSLTGDMTISAGTVTGTNNISLLNGQLTGNGTLSLGSGTTTISRTNTLGGTTPWTFANLVLGNGSVAGTTTPASAATTTVSGRLTISAAHVYDVGSSPINLTGSGTVFSVSGTYRPGTGLVTYSGANATVLGTTYYDLAVGASVGSSTFTTSGVGILVNRNLTIGNGTASSTFTTNQSDPVLTVSGDVFVASASTLSLSDTATTTIAGSIDNNGTVLANGGIAAFTGSGTHTIAMGTSPLARTRINGTGSFTVSESATSTVSFTLQNHALFRVATGTTLALAGTFDNQLGGAATDFPGTLYFYGGSSIAVNQKTTADTYSTLGVASDTRIRLWNSSATTYNALGGIYSQDHNNTNGLLHVYGTFAETSASDYWSYATDFDGTALSGSERVVTVAFASGAAYNLTGGSLSVIGAAGASTSITNQGAGTYGVIIGGSGTANWNYATVRNASTSGIIFTGTPIVTDFSRVDIEVGATGGTGVTIGSTVLNNNPAKNLTNNHFATSTGVSAATNVTATGTAVSSWRFTNHTGSIDGEVYDNDPAGDPGYIVWDDSAALITVSGNVYSDEGVTVSPVCNGVTANIVLRVAGLTTYSTPCNATTGAYSIPNVAFSPADTLTVYIDNNIRKAVTVSADPISSISDMHLYENRVIVRHENTSPLSIADMAVWDSSDDGDILFTAVDAGSDTLSLPADQKLLIWTSKTFEPNGNVTLSGGGGGGAQDGTLEALANATWRAQGNETHSIAGSIIFGAGAVFTAGQSTTTLTTTGAGRTIDVNSGAFYNLYITGSGSWTVADSALTTTRSYTQSAGTVTFGSGTTTIGASFNATGGSFSMPGTGIAFVSSSTGNIVRFDDAMVPALYFTGAGGAWSMTDTNATTTGSFIISNTGTVTLPSGALAVGGSFTNASGTVTHNTADLYMTSASAASITTRGSDLFALRKTDVGTINITDASATFRDDVVIASGSLVAATNTLSVGGSFLVTGGTFSHASGTVLFNATASGKTINASTSPFYNVQFASASGGWTWQGNATTTNNLTLTTASAFTKEAGTSLSIGGVFTNLVGGGATTWTNTIISLTNSAPYTINTKTTGGDDYATLSINVADLRLWNSSVATTTTGAGASLYSQDHGVVDGALNIYGDFTVATTSEYWSYATDFDGTALTGTERAVTVRINENATTTVQSGTLSIIGGLSASTTIGNISTGTHAFIVTGGTFNAQYYRFNALNSTGLNFINTPTITNLSNGYYNLALNGGTLITLADTALNANASKIFTAVGFNAGNSWNGTNTALVGSTSNAWRFSGSYGNIGGEAFDSDGVDACGSIRFDDSGCLLTSQTSYRWRADDGGEGAPNSEWYNLSWSNRQRVRIENITATTFSTTTVKIVVPYDSAMQSDFDDLRFTRIDGVTPLDFWLDRYTASTEAVVWVEVPSLAANAYTDVFAYFGNASSTSSSSAAATFSFSDDFEDNNITEYSGDTTLFQTDTAPVFGGSYALEALNKSGRTTDGIFRTGSLTAQGQVIRYRQYVDTTTGSADEGCALFGVQTPGTNNNNYAVCLELFGTDRLSLSKNVTDNDVSGTRLASTTVTFATGWYLVEIDWQTSNRIDVYLYNAAGSIVASTTATDSSYTSGGMGFTFWVQNGAWDSYQVSGRGPINPGISFGAKQTAGGASWVAAENTLGSGLPNVTRRLRIGIENSGLDVTGQTYRLQYAAKGGAPSCEAVSSGSFAAVPNQASCGSSPVCMQVSSNVTDGEATTDLLTTSNGQFSAGAVVESPSTMTSGLSVNQDRYTELEYVITPTNNASDNYCFRVVNGSTPIDYYAKVAELGLQFDPVIGTVNLNDGFDIALLPGTTTRIYATTTITDFNGASDIKMATTTFYKTASGTSSCTPDDNNCYRVDTSNQCNLQCTGNNCNLICYADIQFFATPSDDGAAEWFAFTEVIDNSGGYDFADSLAVELLTVRSLSINSGINYGSLAPQADTGSYNATTTIANAGNVPFDIEVEGTDLSDGASSVIPANKQKFATSTFTYSGCAVCSLLSSSTPVALDVNLSKPTVPTPPVTTDIFWGIEVPFGVNSAPHSGINVFTPVSP